MAGTDPQTFGLHNAPAFLQADKMMHTTEDQSLKLAGKRYLCNR